MLHFQLRLPEDLAAVVRVAAAANHQSQNAWIVDAIRAAVAKVAHAQPEGSVAAALREHRVCIWIK